MKKKLPILIILVIGIIFSRAQENKERLFHSQSIHKTESSVIDNLDTVVFDMSQAIIVSNSILFPVYILSDDTINSLDFSFMYNQNGLLYDSVANLTNYIQAFSFYNAVDSTVRFTSNSMQVYGIDTPLVAMQFTMLNGNLFNSDIYSITAYLNGDPCSIKIIDPINTNIEKLFNEDVFIKIYPIPANDILHVEASENSLIQIFDLNGGRVFQSRNVVEINKPIDIKNYSEGVYLIKISGNDIITTKKIIIEK